MLSTVSLAKVFRTTLNYSHSMALPTSIVFIAIIGNLITGLFELYMAQLLFKRNRDLNLAAVRVLTLSFLIGTLSRFVVIIRLLQSPELTLIGASGGFDNLLGIFSAYFTLIFLNYYEDLRLSATKIGITTFLATLSLIAIDTGLQEQIFEYSLIYGVMFVVARLLFFVYIIIVATRIINRMKIYATPTQKKSLSKVRLYIYFAFGGVTLVYFLANVLFGTNPENLSDLVYAYLAVLPVAMIFIADLFLYFGYVRVNNPAILQPQRIDKFVIINDQGLPVYNYEIETEVESIDEALFSAAITAISAVLKEATNVVGDLSAIEIGNRYVTLHKQGAYTGVLFAYNQTRFLQEVLSQYMQEVESILGTDNMYEISNAKINELDQRFLSLLAV